MRHVLRVLLAALIVCLILSGWLRDKPVPNELWTILLMIAVYFFHRPDHDRGKLDTSDRRLR